MFFRQVFNTKYNIGFGTPATDVCSTCLRLQEGIKRANSEKDQIDVMSSQIESEKFFDILRDDRNGVHIFSFDCQKTCLCLEYLTRLHITRGKFTF